jgi:hypothetical protein
MNSREQFCDSTCADQMHIAEPELSAFMHAVTQPFGPEEAKLSAEDWFDELIGSPLPSTSRKLADSQDHGLGATGKPANRC